MADAVNPLAELKSAWARYTATISMILFVQYVFIMIMINMITVFLKYGMSEFSRVLLSAILVDLYWVVDRKLSLRNYEPRSIEMEPMMKNASNIHNGVIAPS